MKSSHRFLRSPVPWVLLTIVAVIVVSQLVGSQHSYEEIPT